jgi:signal transduction histidine kinase
MTPATARPLSRTIAAASATAALAAIAVSLQTIDDDTPGLVILLVPLTIYGSIGMLMASRHPANPLGWLFLAVAAVIGFTTFAAAYRGVGAGQGGTGTAPGAEVASWFVTLVPLSTLAFVLPVFLLLYPDGRLLSPRWRWGVALAGLASAMFLVGSAAEATAWFAIATPGWIDAIPGAERLVGAAGIVTVAAAAAGFASLLIRDRRATGDTRAHLRFLTMVMGAMVLATALAPWGGWPTVFLAVIVDGFGILVGIPLATAVAVLTFGLYDVGFVVRKQAVSVGLTIVFVLAFGLLVFSFGGIVSFRGGSEPGWVFVRGLLTGLAILPLRRLAVRLSQRIMFGERTTPYEVLTTFSDRLGDTYATDDVLVRLATLLTEAVGAREVGVWLRIGGELRLEAALPDRGPVPNRPMPTETLPEGLPGTAFEVRDAGEALGAITVVMPANDPMDKRKEGLVRDLASQAGLVVRNVRLIEELRESRRRIVTAQDDRAKRLERDLHDGAQQQLVALAVKLRMVEQIASRDAARATALVAELQTDANDALQTLRDLAHGIYPPLLADKGIVAALEGQARRSPVPVTLEGTVGRHAPEMESALYFCCLEALQNVSKYARASSVTIRLRDGAGELRFEVCDDGDGFDAGAEARGSGLQGMSDRLAALDGILEVRSVPGTGTTVIGRVPLRAPVTMEVSP